MERSVIRGAVMPAISFLDCAALHPGYGRYLLKLEETCLSFASHCHSFSRWRGCFVLCPARGHRGSFRLVIVRRRPRSRPARRSMVNCAGTHGDAFAWRNFARSAATGRGRPRARSRHAGRCKRRANEGWLLQRANIQLSKLNNNELSRAAKMLTALTD